MRFRYEAEMETAVRDHLETLRGEPSNPQFPRRWVTLTEVPGIWMVPDIVLAVVNDDVISARKAEGFVTNEAAAKCLWQLDTAFGDDTEFTVAIAADNCAFSVSYLRATLLPCLAEHAMVERVSRTRWKLTRRWQPAVERMVSVELKLSDWKTGMRQASTAALWADDAWLILDAARSKRFADKLDTMPRWQGVGAGQLCAETGTFKVLRAPQRDRSPNLVWSVGAGRAAMVERIAARVSGGVLEAPPPVVFGRRYWADGTVEDVAPLPPRKVGQRTVRGRSEDLWVWKSHTYLGFNSLPQDAIAALTETDRTP